METETTTEFEGSLQNFYNEFKEEVDRKFGNFKENLRKQKEELKLAFREKLIELQKSSNEMKELQHKSLSREGKTKEQIIEEARILKVQVEDLIKKMEILEKYAENIKNKGEYDLLTIKENEFQYKFDLSQQSFNPENHKAEIIEGDGEGSPAGKPISNACKVCRNIMKWGGYSYYTECHGKSTNCNTHYKYECNTCAVRYCTNCAFPPNVDQCGCGNQLTYTYAAYHCCDLCRASITNNCYRCSTCDFDVCDSCYSKRKK
jgi:hypothetical protein